MIAAVDAHVPMGPRKGGKTLCFLCTFKANMGEALFKVVCVSV